MFAYLLPLRQYNFSFHLSHLTSQIFLWVALQIRRDDDFISTDDCSHSNRMSGGLEKYMELAEGDNGGIMMTFVTRTLNKMENVDENFLVL